MDLKFVTPDGLRSRVEDGLVLWQRDDTVDRVRTDSEAAWPQPDPQWIEDRFWVWVHYAAVKIARGELFEAIETLGALRSVSIAPLATLGRTQRPAGVRRLETLAPELVPQLRDDSGVQVVRRTAAEDAAVAFIRAF